MTEFLLIGKTRLLKNDSILEKAQLDRLVNRLGPRAGPEEGFEGGNVHRYGARVQVELHGNLFVGQAVRQQEQHLALALTRPEQAADFVEGRLGHSQLGVLQPRLGRLASRRRSKCDRLW